MLLGLIPYFEIPSIPIGPFTLQAFGLLAALGILIGAHLAVRAAVHQIHVDPSPLQDAIPWGVLGGLLGGHLLHVFGYHPELLRDPLVILRVWDGLSSMGGVLGGLFAFLYYLHRRGLPLLPYFDALALGTAPGWAIARLGCFVAHDHPGVRTDFPLAVAYPGGARHDLGLYDAIVLGVISVVLYLVARRRRLDGTLIAILAVTYSVPRFFLDFLRAEDVPLADGRILGLTPAQYVSVALVVVGAVLFARARHRAPNPV